MKKCGHQKVSVKLFLCSETQAKIIGRHRLAAKYWKDFRTSLDTTSHEILMAKECMGPVPPANTCAMVHVNRLKNMAAKLCTVRSCKTLW